MRVSWFRSTLYTFVAAFYVFMMGGATCCPGGGIPIPQGSRDSNQCTNLCIGTCGTNSSSCVSNCMSTGCAQCGSSSGTPAAMRAGKPTPVEGKPQVGKKILVP